MELRDFLIELYLKHGEREFVFFYNELPATVSIDDGYIKNVRPIKRINGQRLSYLTPAAIKLINEGTE